MLRKLTAPLVLLVLACGLSGCIFPYHHGYDRGYGGGGGGFAHGPGFGPGPGPGGPGPYPR